MGAKVIRLAVWTLPLILLGCVAEPRIDVAGDIARVSGVDDAVVVRVHAQEDQAPTTGPAILSRGEALRLALHHDPRIQGAIAKVRLAQAEAQQTRLLPNPILNIDVRFPEGGGTQTVEASLTGDLIAILTMPGRIKAVDQRLRGASADMLGTVLDVIAEVQEAYAAVLLADAEAQVLSRRDEILRQLRSVAGNRVAAGEGTRLDVLTLDTQLLQLEMEVSDNRLERTQQRLVLARLIGQPRGETNWELEPWQAPVQINAGESAWIDAALANRPEIQSRAWELAALGEEVNLASLAPLEGGEIGAHGERDQSWAVGPTFTTPLPIFDFGQGARAKAIASRNAAYHELQQQRAEVIEEIRRAYAVYAAAESSLDMAVNRLLPLQQQQRAQAELAYRNGEADLTTLLLADADLQETQSKVVEMQQKLTQAVIRLERAAGGASATAPLEKSRAATQPATTQSAQTQGLVP